MSAAVVGFQNATKSARGHASKCVTGVGSNLSTGTVMALPNDTDWTDALIVDSFLSCN